MLNQPIETPLLSTYDERWKKYRSLYKTCRMEFSGEAVHDLRVASRRLLAMLDIARTLVPHPRVQKARHEIKELIEELDELRDVQVLLVEAIENIQLLPELKSFQKYLKKREAKLLRSAYKHIKQNGLSELSKRIKKIREIFSEEQSVKEFLPRLFEVADNAYSLAEQAYAQIDALQPSSIHRLRLTFKKFRYLVEIIHPYVENYPTEYFERMHHYQDAMGNIQDAEVFLISFSEYTQATKNNSVIDFYTQQLQVLVNDFMENKGELAVFLEYQ